MKRKEIVTNKDFKKLKIKFKIWNKIKIMKLIREKITYLVWMIN